jgi:hypothetical protein
MLYVVLNKSRTMDNVRKHNNCKAFLCPPVFFVFTYLWRPRVIVTGHGSHEPNFFTQYLGWFCNVVIWFVYFLDLWVITFALKCLGKIVLNEVRSSKIQSYRQWRPCRSSAVRRWLPTAARVRVRAACGVCGGQSGTGAGFLRALRFPLPIIPPISPLS